MHGKRAAIAPALAGDVGLILDVAPGIDTDALGAFTGEIARPGTMEETAILKARLGLEASGLHLAVASEGSYGAHPRFPFIPGGLEMIVLVDDALGLVIKETMIAGQTNYQHTTAAWADALTDFLSRASFPSHGLIVRPNRSTPGAAPSLRKGAPRRLQRRFLRARANPRTRSPSCNRTCVRTAIPRAWPSSPNWLSASPIGWRGCVRSAGRRVGASSAPNAACRVRNAGGPTELAQAEIWGCGACGERRASPRSDGMAAAARHCPWCNP